LAGCSPEAEPAGPQIFSIVPNRGQADDVLELRGVGFGAVQGESFVAVGGVIATIGAWAPERVVFALPTLPAGEHLLVLSYPEGESAPLVVSLLP